MSDNTLANHNDERQLESLNTCPSNNNAIVATNYVNLHNNEYGIYPSPTRAMSATNDKGDDNLRNRDIINDLDRMSFPENTIPNSNDNSLHNFLCHLTMLKDMLLPRADGSFVDNWVVCAMQFQMKCEEAFLSPQNRQHVQYILPLLSRQLEYTSNKLVKLNQMDEAEFENFKYLFSIIALGFLAKLRLLSFYLSFISSADAEGLNGSLALHRQMTDSTIVNNQLPLGCESYNYGNVENTHLMTPYRDITSEAFSNGDYYRPGSGLYDFNTFPLNYQDGNVQGLFLNNSNAFPSESNAGGSVSHTGERKTYKKRGRPRGCKNKKHA